MNKKNSPTPELLELSIDSLSYHGGRGVGRVDGMVVFVTGTAPGDRVRARVIERKARFIVAELEAILEPSPKRREPPCPVAGRCGGCSWQHIDYAEQIQQKQEILRSSLRRLGDFQWREFIPAPDEFHYRNRIQLQIQNGKKGFFARGSRELVSFERCWIAEDQINRKLRELKEHELGDARKVELALDESGQLHVMPSERDPEAALFSQVNTRQNEELKRRMLAAVALNPKWIFDLYAGAGNLTLPLREHFPDVQIVAVELSRSSVERAKRVASSIDWQAGDVARVLKTRSVSPGLGLVVCDPPRTGMEKEAIAEILRHRPQQILYVSCNPTTFARDAERLQPAFRLEHVQGLDMFPQTEHVELIASLRAAT